MAEILNCSLNSIAELDRCNPNPCQHSAFCEEINGGVGYVCQCPVGYKGQICNCEYQIRCFQSKTCQSLSCIEVTCREEE